MSLMLFSEGPSGVSIRAPEMVVNGWNYTLECSFEKCFPSCNYTWLVKGKKVGFGRELVYTVPLHNTKHVVICQSQNTLSGLFAAGIATLQVARKLVSIVLGNNVIIKNTLIHLTQHFGGNSSTHSTCSHLLCANVYILLS